MRRSNAPTLQDIAREARVTAMAASVVLNGARSSTRVSEEARARILEAAARLRYRRNAAARGLQRRCMDTIGVVAIVDSGDINLYFIELLNGILQAASEHRQNTTVFAINDWRAEEPQILASCDGRVDGMILLGPDVTPAFAETLHQHTPFVAIHSNQTLPPHACNLSVDNEGGAYAAVRHLLARGHRRIAHVTGGESADAVRRRAGYRRALEAAGVAADEALILPGDFHIGSGRRVMTELLDNRHGASLPTAIFCASDAIAYGCMEVLAARGLRAPRDLSVVGFDDVLLARMTSPPLTTVRQPLRAMGARAVELLLSQIHGPAPEGVGGDATAAPAPAPDPVPATEVFAVELVLRDSVGPPPHR